MAQFQSAAKKFGQLTWQQHIRKWCWTMSGFHKYGLKYNDCFHETDEVKEALRRLPPRIQDERTFRIIRAMQCSIQKVYLPKEEWMKFEDDDFYLKPYLEEVQREVAERKEWAKN